VEEAGTGVPVAVSTARGVAGSAAPVGNGAAVALGAAEGAGSEVGAGPACGPGTAGAAEHAAQSAAKQAALCAACRNQRTKRDGMGRLYRPGLAPGKQGRGGGEHG